MFILRVDFLLKSFKIKYGCKKENERKAAYAKLYVKPSHESNIQGKCCWTQWICCLCCEIKK